MLSRAQRCQAQLRKAELSVVKRSEALLSIAMPSVAKHTKVSFMSGMIQNGQVVQMQAQILRRLLFYNQETAPCLEKRILNRMCKSIGTVFRCLGRNRWLGVLRIQAVVESPRDCLSLAVSDIRCLKTKDENKRIGPPSTKPANRERLANYQCKVLRP